MFVEWDQIYCNNIMPATILIIKIIYDVKESRYRPGVAQRVPGS